MKKFLTITLASVLLLAGGSVAYANICAFDPVPAATLLFPFAAYNYGEGANGVNTLFAITNVSADAQIVHITLWTDYSVPILDWNVLLTGYDVYTFDMRSILADGVIPATFAIPHGVDKTGAPDPNAKEGVIDGGPVSHVNETANWMGPDDYVGPLVDNNHSGLWWPESTYVFELSGACDSGDEAYPGNFDGLEIDEQVLNFFQTMLQISQTKNSGFNNCEGVVSNPAGTWWSDRDTDDDTWAYVTADVVSACNKEFPDGADYYDLYLEYQNVLIGDVIWVDRTDGYSEVSNAVHIEAASDDRGGLGGITTPGPNRGDPISFYARYSQASPATTPDNREPLPTGWAFRYITGQRGNSDLSTFVRAFKTNTNAIFPIVPDLYATLSIITEESAMLIAYNCMAYTYYIWDEEENINVLPPDDLPFSGWEADDQPPYPNYLPLETQEVNAEEFGLVDDSGWMLFVWPYSNYGDFPLAYDPPTQPFDWENGPLFYQTWMGVKYVTERADGTGYSGAKDGAVMANYNCFQDQRLLFDLGIDYPYTWYGEYTRWTGSSE